MKFARGNITQEMRIIGDTDRHGTIVTFKPDPEMFDTLVYDYETLHTRMREQAFLNAGLRIEIADRRTEDGPSDSMCYEGGIREFVLWHNRHKTPLHEEVVYMAGVRRDAEAEVALQYHDGYNETIVSFANNIHTPEGGMHETGFKTALTRVLNAYGTKTGVIKTDADKVSGEDCREGLTAVISVKLTDAQFEGQTKAKLGNAYIRTLVDSIVNEQLSTYFEEHPAVARTILEKAMTANRAREAARKARESIRRKTALGGAAMPDKLRDCNETDASLTEIYIVEGDSAGGSATQGRDSRFQAILPLWGKMLNVEKVREDKVIGNDKLQPVITALGAGIGEEFHLDKLRYHKIIIMADADVDGSHIRTLLLTFFFRYMRPLIEHGYVYSAMPPLYKLTRGKTSRVAFSDDERDRISAELRADNPNAKVDISRYKGLGEMDAHELWETTMDPEKRTLKQIRLEDAVKADEIFTLLMGEKVEPRKDILSRMQVCRESGLLILFPGLSLRPFRVKQVSLTCHCEPCALGNRVAWLSFGRAGRRNRLRGKNSTSLIILPFKKSARRPSRSPSVTALPEESHGRFAPRNNTIKTPSDKQQRARQGGKTLAHHKKDYQPEDIRFPDQAIVTSELVHEMKTSYMEYAMSVINRPRAA